MGQAKDSKGRFLAGNSGGGRPKGARSKLSEQFLAAMLADFEVHGVATIAAVRTEKPEIYLRVIASMLPKEIVSEVRITATSPACRNLARRQKSGWSDMHPSRSFPSRQNMRPALNSP